MKAAAQNILAIILAAILLATFATACHTGSSRTSVEPRLLQLSGDLGVHDPCIIADHGVYYIFCTGGARRGIIPMFSSTNLQFWTSHGTTLPAIPEWGTREIPLARDAWAPDISYFNGKFHLYYALSSFGVNNSAIGLAVNDTLDPSDPRYHWQDQGLVVRSKPGVDDFNAIDPNLVIEDRQNVWLCWGSFWGGIKMRRIDPASGKLSDTDTNLYSLASRPRSSAQQTPPVEGAVEAPTIIRHGNYWYLFASYDFCCRGASSTYNVKVGRARKLTGPYLDRDGKPLTADGGTTVIPATTPRWRGAGGEAVLQRDGQDYLVFHAYDPVYGQPQLQISSMTWQDGWPRVAIP